jgi:hypothetical protein
VSREVSGGSIESLSLFEAADIRSMTSPALRFLEELHASLDSTCRLNLA